MTLNVGKAHDKKSFVKFAFPSEVFYRHGACYPKLVY